MDFCSLSSGSSGNCIFISSGNSQILIDDGLSLKELEKRAAEKNIDLSKINGIVLSHDHSDHTKGAGVFAKKYGVPIFAHEKCFNVINAKYRYINDYYAELSNFESGFYIGDLKIKPFRVPHDSQYSLCYRVENSDKSVSVVTDLGEATSNIVNVIKGSDIVLLESNHDVNLLKNTSRPMSLINRILSKNGHLSNYSSNQVAIQLLDSGTKNLLLGHISKEANTYELVKKCFEECLIKEEMCCSDLYLEIATQENPSKLLTI